LVNDVVARLFDDPPNVILDVTVGLAEAVVLVLLGLLNEGAECVVVAVGFFSSAL
jgi:aspartate/methionine/tyrosine aminotransferase